MENDEFLTKQQVIEKYKPMFTEWSLSKLIRKRRIKFVRIGRRIFFTKKAVDDFIKSQEESSILNERRDFHIV